MLGLAPDGRETSHFTFPGIRFRLPPMEATPRKQVKITCPVCTTQLDVTDQKPFDIVACTKCGEKLLVPMQLGNYRLLSTIGGGGMGMVYKAVDMSLGRQVAVKLLRKDLASDPHFVETFTREARAVAALNHPNIATLYSFGSQEGQYYLVMELVPGGSLDDMIDRRKRIPEAEVLDIAIQVVSGLRQAHQRGLIHRDIKPGNILFTADGKPKIVDFGLAEFHTDSTKPQQPTEGGIWGTPYYIAPEKVAGEKEDFRSDMYSLGGTLFHALAGRAPFEANTATDVVMKHMTTPALSLMTFAPDITEETAQVVGRMLAKNRAQRYNSYDALLADLETAKRDLTKERVKASQVMQAKVQRSTKRTVLIVAGVIVGILVCLIGLWTQRDQIFPEKEPVVPDSVTGVVVNADGTITRAKPAWDNLWRQATAQLNQGNFAAAIDSYDEVLKKQDANDPVHLWTHAQKGFCYTLAGNSSNAVESYTAAIPSNAPRYTATAEITPGTLATFVAQAVTDQLPPEALLARAPQMPLWGQALVRFHCAALALKRDDPVSAQRLFVEYAATPPTDDEMWQWAHSFGFLAPALALECEAFVRWYPQILKAEKERDLDTATAAIQNLRGSVKYCTPFLARVSGIEANIKKELAAIEAKRKAEEEARQKELAAKQKELLEQDQKYLAQIDTSAPAYVASFVFAPLVTAYQTAAEKMQSEQGKQEATARVTRYRSYADLKSAVIAEINQKPWRGPAIMSRSGTAVQGTLAKADEDKLSFKLAYGEIPLQWRQLPPAEVLKIFAWYVNQVADQSKKAALAASLQALREELKVG